MKKEDEVRASKTQSAADRRAFLKGAGFTGLGLAGATLLGGKLGLTDALPGASKLGLGATAVEAAGITDVDILNFALNLEYLEAEFYTLAVTGKNLEQSGYHFGGKGNYGATTGGNRVAFGGALGRELGMTANALMESEVEHVLFLRKALGSAAVAKPAIDADAIGGFANYNQFIAVSRALEQTGESAYIGAAPLISNKAYLLAAAKILAIEAEHVGNIRLFCDIYNVPTTRIDWMDILPPPTGKSIFTLNSDGTTPSRTASQVLAIVYGSSKAGTTHGGFFPQGLNGNIRTV